MLQDIARLDVDGTDLHGARPRWRCGCDRGAIKSRFLAAWASQRKGDGGYPPSRIARVCRELTTWASVSIEAEHLVDGYYPPGLDLAHRYRRIAHHAAAALAPSIDHHVAQLRRA